MFDQRHCIFSIIFFSVSVCASAQIGISDDTKKNLLQSVKPKNNFSIGTPSVSKQKTDEILNNKYIDAYNKYKSGSQIILPAEELSINPHVFTYNGKIPANQLPAGSLMPVYMGGHFVMVPTGGINVKPSGICLTGWNPKKLSEQSKSILKNVFGMEIEE